MEVFFVHAHDEFTDHGVPFQELVDLFRTGTVTVTKGAVVLECGLDVPVQGLLGLDELLTRCRRQLCVPSGVGQDLQQVVAPNALSSVLQDHLLPGVLDAAQRVHAHGGVVHVRLGLRAYVGAPGEPDHGRLPRRRLAGAFDDGQAVPPVLLRVAFFIACKLVIGFGDDDGRLFGVGGYRTGWVAVLKGWSAGFSDVGCSCRVRAKRSAGPPAGWGPASSPGHRHGPPT